MKVVQGKSGLIFPSVAAAHNETMQGKKAEMPG